MISTDVAIIGGGIVGLATAYQFTRELPGRRVVVLEKEAELALHQTGHNSGVLHSGIYYKPGSLKAINCRQGKRLMEEFCAAEGISYEICGKVIVALDDSELPAMERIFERGQANGVLCEVIGRERLTELEPHAAGIRAIHVPEAGIVNYKQVCQRLAERVRERDGQVLTSARVTQIERSEDRVILTTAAGEVEARQVVNCAGLHCDRVTAMSGQKPDAKIVPFRGEYFELKPEATHLCKNLIYPVPDPNFPFLGVHFTRMIEGGVECGPNAVLAFAREGYRKTDFNLADMAETLSYSGFLQDGGQVLEDRPGRDVAVGEQGGVRQGAPAARPRDPRRAPGRRAGRDPGAGRDARRLVGRRLPDPGGRPGHQRQQRPIAGRDRLAQHRQDDRRAAGSPARLTQGNGGDR